MESRFKLTPRQIEEERVLVGFYQILGYPYFNSRNVLVTHPREFTLDQVKIIRNLTLDLHQGNATIEALREEAFGLEPGWENLSPEKRFDVARSGSELFHRAFGHNAVENQLLPA